MSYPTQPTSGQPGQIPPGAPGQYPPPGAPGQYPPPGAPGQYPPPAAPGQYPPPGTPGQYPPPGAPGQYPPPGAPGQYPPPGAPGQYPPPGAPGQYPPPGAPGQYPPPGAPGQYPPSGAPGQYPPPGIPGQYPPPGAPGQYPPPGIPGGQYPPAGHPSGGHMQAGGHGGFDADDSDNEDVFRSKHSKHPVHVKFINKTNQKVTLYWINEKGKFKKMEKLKEGRAESIDTFETHPFIAESKKGPDAVINGNVLFLPHAVAGGHGEVKAEITLGPKDRDSLHSTATGHPTRVKFSNRTHKYAVLKWIDPNGKEKVMKEIAPKKAFVLDSYEGHYFIATEKGREHEMLDLNYSWFHLAKKTSGPHSKVLITEAMDDSSSSSSG